MLCLTFVREEGTKKRSRCVSWKEGEARDGERRGKAELEDVGLCREALFQLCLSGSKFWGEWW